MSTFHRLFIISLFVGSTAGPVLAQSSLPVDVAEAVELPQPISESASQPSPQPISEPSSKKTQAHYVNECKAFISQKLYEPALFSCYNAYQLGSTDMGAVLYRLGKYHFFDEATSNNLKQEYKAYKGSPEIQRLLVSIKFSSQSNYIAQGSIYGSWCLDQDMNHETEGESLEGRSFEGYARLVINPTGHYINASAKIEEGSFEYSNNVLSLGYPNYSEYQVSLIDNNQLILKTDAMKTAQVYSRKSCSKMGMQRFVQALVNSKSATQCDDISNYLGRQLIPTQYLPTEIVNKLKQDPKRYDCPQLIQKISEAYAIKSDSISSEPNR